MRLPFRTACTIALAISATAALSSRAANWKITVDGYWNYAPNWNTGVVPGAGEDVYITLPSFSDFSVTENQNYTPETAIGALVVNMPRPVTLTLKLTDLHSDLYAASETIGSTYGANVVQSGHTTNGVTGMLTLGSGTYGNGSYSLSGLALSVGAGEVIGYAGAGNFTQSGGTNSIYAGDLRIGVLSGSFGTYTQTNGALSINGGLFVGLSGSASFYHYGGTVTCSQLYVAPPIGTNTGGELLENKGVLTTGTVENHGNISLFTAGGSFSATYVNNYGSFSAQHDLTITSGFYNVGTASFGGAQHWSNGTSFYNDVGGTASFTSDLAPAGGTTDAYVSGGNVVIDTSMHLRTLAMSGSGQVIVPDDVSPSAGRTLQLGTLSFTKPGATFEGQLDLTVNRLSVATADGYTLSTYLQSGYANGTWKGTGIISHTSDARHGLGYGTSASGWIVQPALYGDTNLDGRVDFTDLLAVARNYGGTFTFWSAGDFNYDRSTNFSDLLALARNYGQSDATSASAQLESLNPAFAADWALAQSLVPEPGTLSVVALAVAALAPRRRRGRHFSGDHA